MFGDCTHLGEWQLDTLFSKPLGDMELVHCLAGANQPAVITLTGLL